MNLDDLRAHSPGYVFVLTPIELKGGVGTELAPGHRIQKATPEQVAKIKELLALSDNRGWSFSPYEQNIMESKDGEHGSTHRWLDSIPQGQWRYWVVAFECGDAELSDLQMACTLSPQDVELGFHVICSTPESIPFLVGRNSEALNSFFHSGLDMIPPKQICEQDLLQIRRNFDDIKKLSPQHPHIKRAMSRFDELRSLPRSSEMSIIGIFSIIESLITHAPKLTESADSLSHQLQTKLPLVRRRFHPDLDHSKFFPDVPEEKVWKVLYDYRSKIVHGADSRLCGKLQVLKNIATVTDFLRSTTKRLLKLSLSEPVFMTDLKEC